MNYVAGFLLTLWPQEDVVFKALSVIISKYSMQDLFNPDLPRLKLFFMQLDGLLQLQCPQLHKHLLQENL